MQLQHDPRIFRISSETNVAEARRYSVNLANLIAFDETDTGRIALIVTEMGTNLVKHVPQGGELLVQPLQANGVVGIEVLALDQGAGLRDVATAMRDGYSTAGSPGTGLGAIRRLSSFSDIYSRPGAGVALLAHLWPRNTGKNQPATSSLTIGSVRVSKPGQPVCGDAWEVVSQGGTTTILVADGLGHGAGAAEASQSAVSALEQNIALPPEELLKKLHGELYRTRGAAVALVRIDASRAELQFVGVGNIAGVIQTPERSRHLVSHNGTLGHAVRKIQMFAYPWSEAAVLILHSDGLSGRWNLENYPGLIARHPSLIAGILYRDFKRDHDDIVVVVARQERKR